MKNTRRALFLSVVSMFLCVVMLASTTFAWFTDSVESTGNIIKTGTLKVDLLNDGVSLKTNTDHKIFDYSLWEPGYTQVEGLKLVNNGNLNFKYQLAIVPNGAVSALANVIDVYLLDSAAERTDLTNKIGTLASILNAGGVLISGNTAALTLSDGAVVFDKVVALKMQESAGNEYQDMSLVTGGFSVRLLATQLTKEEDSFDDQYDAAADWIGNIPASLDDTTLVIEPTLGEQTGTITINSPEDLVYLNKLANEWVSLYSNGQGTNVGSYRESEGGKGTDYYYYWTWKLELAADLNMNNIPMDSVNLAFWRSFEGNGHTILNVVIKDGQTGLFTANGSNSISNLNVKNIVVNAPSSNTVGALANHIGSFNKVNLENATVTGNKYVGGLAGKSASVIDSSVNNSTVTGNDKTVGGLIGYSIGDPNPATVSGNTVYNVTVVGAYNVGGLLGQSQNETVDGNTVKNVTVKSTMALPADASSNEVCVAEVAARSAFANTTIGANVVENVTLVEGANVSGAGELTDALNSGKTDIVLGAGTYKLPAEVKNKTVTISGTKDTVIDVTSGLTYINGASVTFDGVTIKSTPGTGYNYGFADAKDTVFNNCTIEGTLGLDYSCEFNNCVFNISGNNYNIWTWGAGTATFNGCTFNCDGKAMLVYANALDNGTYHQTININNCVFNDNGDDTVTGKAAIEITNTYTPIRTYDVIINKTTVNGFAQTVPGAGDFNAAYGSVEGSDIGTNVWGNKCKLPNTQINVVIDGVDVY